MRGFELLGRLAAPLSFAQKWHYLDDKTGVQAMTSDLIALSPYRDGPLRAGLTRVYDVRRFDADLRIPGLMVDIPAAAAGDYVFVARAVGARTDEPITPELVEAIQTAVADLLSNPSNPARIAYERTRAAFPNGGEEAREAFYKFLREVKQS